jgi:hypothetical protein
MLLLMLSGCGMLRRRHKLVRGLMLAWQMASALITAWHAHAHEHAIQHLLSSHWLVTFCLRQSYASGNPLSDFQLGTSTAFLAMLSAYRETVVEKVRAHPG